MPLKKKHCRDWRLYVITDSLAVGKRTLPELVRSAIEGGADVIQLRDKFASDEALADIAERLLAVTRPLGIPLIINDRAEVAKKVSADGVHLGQEDGPLAAARELLGEAAIIGRSTHSPEQALAAQAEGFDYIGIGPVFGTPTKPDYTPVGLELVRFAVDNIRIPFVAIGGINETNAAAVSGAGAKTMAVVRAVIGSTDPKSSAEQILNKINEKK